MDSTSEYYQDKVAVVTGGASGIGLALAEMILSYGAKQVVLVDINDENLERETARLGLAHAGKVLGLRDVTKEEDVQGMIREAAAPSGRIDILFNNAGAGLSGNFDKQTNEDWERAFALNFYGALYGIRAVLPVMRKQGGGHVVNIISGIAFMPMAQQTMYAATKAALNGLTLALRYELWDENIRVSSATPGTTATSIWKAVEPPPGRAIAETVRAHHSVGVAKNERLVLGDEGDVSGAKICFNPDAAAGVEQYLLNVARKRRSGESVV